MFESGTEYGVLKHKYTRAQTYPCDQQCTELNDATKKTKDIGK